MHKGPDDLAQARAALKRHWGYPSFRPGQEDVVEAVLEGHDALAILPTGGGKSICYQVPALLREGFTLVVSPLIALMQDQVAHLRAHGIEAAFINSTLRPGEIDQRWTDAEFGRYRLLYVAPERLQTDVFLARAERLPVSLLAVDEAHCVSEWGHHFRPSYLEITHARALLGDPPTLAVTATATPEVRRDIVEHLGLRNPHVVVKGFDRPEIVWSIFRTENKRARVMSVVKGVAGPGIVYCATRRGVDEWASRLRDEGESVAAYHGGLAIREREQAQRAWITGDARIVVATNAFGMGIDKADVRFVVHVDVPGSLEAYYQEAGRAGRDGKKAYAVLLFRPGDEQTQRALIEEGHPEARSVAQVYDAVCSLAQIPYGVLPEVPVAVDQDAVARLTGFSPARIQTAIDLLVRQGTWQRVPARKHQGLIRFNQPADVIRLQADSLSNAALGRFVRTLLRTVHADAFSGWWKFDLRLLETRTRLPRARLERGLRFLQTRGILDWRPPGEALRVQLAEPRSQRLPVDDVHVRRARRRAETRLADMLRYARSVTCRRHFLLAYFGEGSTGRCGACDVCLGRHRPVVITPEDEPLMRRVLGWIDGQTPRAAWEVDAVPSEHLEGVLDWLVQEGYLDVENPLEDVFVLTDKAHEMMAQWRPRRGWG